MSLCSVQFFYSLHVVMFLNCDVIVVILLVVVHSFC